MRAKYRHAQIFCAYYKRFFGKMISPTILTTKRRKLPPNDYQTISPKKVWIFHGRSANFTDILNYTTEYFGPSSRIGERVWFSFGFSESNFGVTVVILPLYSCLLVFCILMWFRMCQLIYFVHCVYYLCAFNFVERYATLASGPSSFSLYLVIRNTRRNMFSSSNTVLSLSSLFFLFIPSVQISLTFNSFYFFGTSVLFLSLFSPTFLLTFFLLFHFPSET